MLIGALLYPVIAQFITGGNGDALVGLAADAGVFVLLAIGLNVVVGFAGLLDLGYAAFFAIGAYTYAMIASNELATSPLHHALHVPFWIALFVGLFIAAVAGALLGAPTLRLRGDYLAIVTLGFGEIVPRVHRNLNVWTGGVFGFTISITVLSMVVLGGMGNIPGAMIGGVLLYFILYKFLPDAPNQVASLFQSIGLGWLNNTNPNGWPGIGEEVNRLKFIIFGLILVLIMLYRPQGLLPSRARRQELTHDEVA